MLCLVVAEDLSSEGSLVQELVCDQLVKNANNLQSTPGSAYGLALDTVCSLKVSRRTAAVDLRAEQNISIVSVTVK
jgi:hypothetical protein